jgi:hypothetical protein
LGIKDIGGQGLGNNSNEILVASNHFSSTVIVPIQKVLIKLFDRLVRYYGYPEVELFIEPLKLFDEDGTKIGDEQVDAQA